MKCRTVYAPILMVVFCLFGTSCKKGSDSTKPPTRVTYTITDGDNSIINIAFRDANGEMQILNNYAGFGGAEKTIEVKEKPFEASVQIIVSNTSPFQKVYVLGISVEGELKKSQGLFVPKNSLDYESEKLTFVVQ